MVTIPVLLIKLYKLVISPVLPNACRFYPTCSQYAIEALTRHGLFKGGFLSVKRILRCHPFCDGGYDPVP
ncbi:MAG: membrane protein insertion efficiency factor YidD [Spirochaetota bacterium]